MLRSSCSVLISHTHSQAHTLWSDLPNQYRPTVGSSNVQSECYHMSLQFSLVRKQPTFTLLWYHAETEFEERSDWDATYELK